MEWSVIHHSPRSSTVFFYWLANSHMLTNTSERLNYIYTYNAFIIVSKQRVSSCTRVSNEALAIPLIDMLTWQPGMSALIFTSWIWPSVRIQDTGKIHLDNICMVISSCFCCHIFLHFSYPTFYIRRNLFFFFNKYEIQTQTNAERFTLIWSSQFWA
jgi:hypothetical protein